MINTVRLWTRKPSRSYVISIEKNENSVPRKESAKKVGFLEGFFKMWENQADLMIRNMND